MTSSSKTVWVVAGRGLDRRRNGTRDGLCGDRRAQLCLEEFHDVAGPLLNRSIPRANHFLLVMQQECFLDRVQCDRRIECAKRSENGLIERNVGRLREAFDTVSTAHDCRAREANENWLCK